MAILLFSPPIWHTAILYILIHCTMRQIFECNAFERFIICRTSSALLLAAIITAAVPAGNDVTSGTSTASLESVISNDGKNTNNATVTPLLSTSTGTGVSWVEVFRDDFNRAGFLDPTKWNADNVSSTVNAEMEFYTPDEVSVHGTN